MHIVLFVLSVLVFLIGLMVWTVAAGAIHEIYSGVFFVISAVLLSGAAVVDAIHRLRREVVVAARS